MTLAAYAIIALFAGWALFLGLKWRATYRAESSSFELFRQTGELKPSVAREDFKRLYLRSEGPRFWTYVFVSLVVVVLVFPLVLGLFNLVWVYFWHRSGELPWFEAGQLVHGLIFAMFSVAAMFALAYVAMRAYHSNRPQKLRTGLKRLNGEHDGD